MSVASDSMTTASMLGLGSFFPLSLTSGEYILKWLLKNFSFIQCVRYMTHFNYFCLIILSPLEIS